MGCDIHTWVERKTQNGWELLDVKPEIFGYSRHYGLFGWLANVRNYSAIPPAFAGRGLPEDLSEGFRNYWGGADGQIEFDYHNAGFVLASELLQFDYKSVMEDRRVTAKLPSGITSVGCTAPPGEGQKMTYAVFLGEWVLAEIIRLCALGEVRLIFGFDS